MRRRIAVFGLLGALLAGLAYLPLALLAPLTPAQATAVTSVVPENPPITLTWPGYGASAIGAVGFPGTLAAADGDAPRTIASITKVITSLVVLEAKPLGVDEAGPTLTMTAADVALYHSYFAQNGSVEPVRAGLQLTQREVMTAVLVASANNYAETLSTWAFGSQSEFLAATRTWLDRHGMAATTILDSSGMNPGNISTAHNLVELARLALADPIVSAIVRTGTAELPYIGTITNTNKLLGIDGIDGIKTGTLDEAGACLLFSASITVGDHPVEVVGVVLGAPNHRAVNAAVRELLASATAGFRVLPLVSAGDVFYEYSLPWDQSAKAVAMKDESALVWAGTDVKEKSVADPVLVAPAGKQVGSVTFTIADRTITVPLALDTELTEPGLWWRLTHPFG